MKAWVYREYGGPEVVHPEDVPKPVPKDDEVLVKVHATTVSAGDWRALTLEMPPGFAPFGRLIFGIRRPRRTILGGEFAGTVAEVGRAVTRFRPGDAVFGAVGARMGCHAQLVAVPEKGQIARKPDAIPFEEAAALSFGGTTALDFLDRGEVKAGESVLVIGASGAVGSAIVQLATHRGARVTGVASAANADLLRRIGAVRAIDYAKEDALAGADRYDVIVDTVGETPLARCKHALRDGGRLLAVAGTLGTLVGAPLHAKGKKRVVAGVAPESRAIGERLAELAASGAFRPVIDHVYEFSQMREAHARVASRRKRGVVVVRVPQDP